MIFCPAILFNNNNCVLFSSIQIGWCLKSLVNALKENQKEVTLTLAKRPRHANPLGGQAHRNKKKGEYTTNNVDISRTEEALDPRKATRTVQRAFNPSETICFVPSFHLSSIHTGRRINGAKSHLCAWRCVACCLACCTYNTILLSQFASFSRRVQCGWGPEVQEKEGIALFFLISCNT